MKKPLRSAAWFNGPEYYARARRAWIRSEGLPASIFDNKPVVGIANSWSEFNNCNAHLRTVAEAVKRGVWAAGGVPFEFPTISLGEMHMKPTAMLFRNLMAMDVEECIRAYPMDAVVLLCGCDKTTPAQLMGAASADLPSIIFPGGPMMAGQWRGRKLGSGTDGRKLFDQLRTGRITEEEWCEIESCLARTVGHCTVIGTASTMACLMEAIGMALPGSASIPAVDARRLVAAEEAGRRAVEMVAEDLRPSRILTRAAFENAITALMALGGSTNAVVHLLAIAGRVGVDLSLADFDRISRTTPVLANLKPNGEFLMEDLFEAGGVPAVLHEIAGLLHLDAPTIAGQPLAASVQAAANGNTEVIRPFSSPFQAEGGIATLHGNLAPDGAVIKTSAASPNLLRHRGRAIVFTNRERMLAELDADNFAGDENSVLVLTNAGPIGGPGFPEWGQIPLPKKMIRQGVTDMVRISDARMSGTSFGTVVLHVSPESAIGGPLAAVQTGDEIELDTPNRTLTLCVSDSELARRLKSFEAPKPHYTRGYGRLFLDHVTQAHKGCDFDFLQS